MVSKFPHWEIPFGTGAYHLQKSLPITKIGTTATANENVTKQRLRLHGTGPEPFRTEPDRIGFCLHGIVWNRSRGPFLESPGNFSGPESYFMCAMFALKTQILLVLKAEQ